MKRRTGKSNSLLIFVKNHKKIMISLVVVVTFFGLFLTINYGRYVKDIIEVYYLRTKNFYFNSDKLSIHENEAVYEVEPWNGVDTYPLTVQLNSKLNSLKWTTSNILYEAKCSVEGNITCSSKAGGTSISRTIRTDTRTSSFTFDIKPTEELKEGDRVEVYVVAKSIFPYEEELSAKFIFIVGDYGTSYVIEDVPGDIYCNVVVTNSLPDDRAKINLKVKDTSLLTFDMTSSIFSIDDLEKYTDSDSNINEVVFTLEPKSSMLIRFYKSDAKENYSHFSYDGESEVIEFSAEELS